MKKEQSVPKSRHIKFRRRGITQKKEYNIQNTEKFDIKEFYVCQLRYFIKRVFKIEAFNEISHLTYKKFHILLVLSIYTAL
jgi:hypothetical protein